MTVKFITVKGSENVGRSPFYIGVAQHERTMPKRETYEYCAERTGYTATAVRAVFLALAEYIKENQRRGNITYLDGVASIHNYVKGAFDGLAGTDVFSIAGSDLAPDATKDDEYVALVICPPCAGPRNLLSFIPQRL